MSRRTHPRGGSLRMRRAYLFVAVRALPWEVTKRLCDRCWGSGLAGGVEYVEPITTRVYRPKNGVMGPGELRTFGGTFCFVSRTCPRCGGEGAHGVPTKRGRGGRR